MQINTQLIAWASIAVFCVSCSSVETSTIRKTTVVVGTVIEIDTTEETLRYTLIDTTVLCNIVISVEAIDDNSMSEFTPMMIIIPQSLGDSLGVKGALSVFFGSGQKWRFDARMLDSEDSPLEVGSFVEGVPMIMIAERAELVVQEAAHN